ncbi:hypothetical protein ABPG75_002807 [Micractinium tetrahymenae]
MAHTGNVTSVASHWRGWAPPARKLQLQSCTFAMGALRARCALLLAFVAAAWHAVIGADIVYLSNIGSSILDTDAFDADSWLTVSFKTGPSLPPKSGPHRLWEVRVRVDCKPAPCTLRLTVWTADPASHAPKAKLWAMTQRVTAAANSIVSFRPAKPWLLAPSAGYAIVLQTLGPGSVGQWAYASQRNVSAQAPGWDYVGWGSSDNSGRSWKMVVPSNEPFLFELKKLDHGLQCARLGGKCGRAVPCCPKLRCSTISARGGICIRS